MALPGYQIKRQNVYYSNSILSVFEKKIIRLQIRDKNDNNSEISVRSLAESGHMINLANRWGGNWPLTLFWPNRKWYPPVNIQRLFCPFLDKNFTLNINSMRISHFYNLHKVMLGLNDDNNINNLNCQNIKLRTVITITTMFTTNRIITR